MTTATQTKEEALAEFLGYGDTDDIEQSSYDENTFEVGNREYLVLTDEEADERVSEQIEGELWAFNAEFVASHSSVNLSSKAIEALKKMQGELCEDANELMRALIKDFDHFVKDAVSSDGRGHFLSPYDGEENEEGEYFIYRTN